MPSSSRSLRQTQLRELCCAITTAQNFGSTPSIMNMDCYNSYALHNFLFAFQRELASKNHRGGMRESRTTKIESAEKMVEL